MIWLTGDTHGHFERIEAFCREKQTTVDDILIILGDAGFNFGGGARDLALKTYASQFPITIFSLHGNRENRPQNIPGYSWVYVRQYCAKIDEAARNRMELIVPELVKRNGVTEQLKAENQMEWVRQMNACKAQAEEIVKAELIYD